VTPTKRSLLIVDDEPYILRTLILYVNPHYEVLTADSADAAEAIFRQRPVDLLLTDQKMPKCSGIQFLEWVRQFSPRTVRLLMTGPADLEEAVESINRGHVYYYLLKPFRPEDLLLCLRNAAERFELESYRDQLLDDLHQLNRDLEQRVAQ